MSNSVAVGSLLALLAATVAVLLGRPLPDLLRRLGAGKVVNQYQPSGHQAKTGTPSMAGLLFTGVTLVIGVLLVAPAYPHVWWLGALLVATAALGLADDLSSTQRFQRGGMRARVKLYWLLAIAVVAATILQVILPTHRVHLPFAGTLDLGLLYWPLAVLVLVGSSNAVNLTDGLDGLAGGTMFFAAAAFAIISFIHGEVGAGIFLLVLIGALLGFLWHNVHPARFFMGDTGALALGAVLGGVALLTGEVMALLVVGAVFVGETLSVIIQVSYFKRTGGKRIFRSTPIHNHFELIGWPETRIVQRFWLIGALAAVVGVGLALAA